MFIYYMGIFHLISWVTLHYITVKATSRKPGLTQLEEEEEKEEEKLWSPDTSSPLGRKWVWVTNQYSIQTEKSSEQNIYLASKYSGTRPYLGLKSIEPKHTNQLINQNQVS